MGNIISKVKETVANIDVKQIAEDVKTKIEYLDMGNLLGSTVGKLESMDTSAIKAKVNDFRKNPTVEKIEDTAKNAAGAAVEFVSGLIKK